MTQYINFTSMLDNEVLWLVRNSVTVTDTNDASPGGGNWYTIDTTDIDSNLNQDIRDDGLANKRLQLSFRVRSGSGGGLATAFRCDTLENNTANGRVDATINLVDGTVNITYDNYSVISTDSDSSQSVFITEESTGVYRVAITIDVPANTNRIIYKLHVSKNNDAVDITDCNIIEHNEDGVADFVFFTREPKLTPTRYTSKFTNPLNPDMNEADPSFAEIWNIEDPNSITYDVVHQIATPDELYNLFEDVLPLNPELNHKIEITTDDWTDLATTQFGDIRISENIDFLGNGGMCYLTTQSGNLLRINKRFYITNRIDGLYIQNIKTLWTVNHRSDPDSISSYNRVCLYVIDGKYVFDGIEGGTMTEEGFTMLDSATLFSLNASGEGAQSTVCIKNLKSRGALNDIHASGPWLIYEENTYKDGQFQDSNYARMSSGNHSYKTQRWFKKNTFNGPVSSEIVYLVCVNTTAETWTVPGEVYPFEVGQLVQQDSGFAGIIEHIYKGDGVTNSPHVDACRTIEGTEGVYGWKGDLLIIRATDETANALNINEELYSDTAAYTPQFFVTGGAPTGMDGGLLLGFLHTDGHQYGSGSDKEGSSYEIFTAGWFACMSGTNAGAVQLFIHNDISTGNQKHFSRNIYAASSSPRAHPINHTDTVIENCLFTLAPLGTEKSRALADPAVSFGGIHYIPTINVSTRMNLLDRGDYDHSISKVVSKSNINPNYTGFDYPYLQGVTALDPYAEPNSENSYESIFGKQLGRSVIDGAIIEKVPVIPPDGTIEQCQAIIANWFDWYRTPVFDGGWDLTVDQSGNGFAHPLNYGKDYNPGRVPIITFTEWPHQIVEQGSDWTPPTFSSTDGMEDLTGSVTITETVDTNQLGYQWVKYDVTNSDGNSVTTYTVVEVVPKNKVSKHPKPASRHLLNFKVVDDGGNEIINTNMDNPSEEPEGIVTVPPNSGTWKRYKKVGDGWVGYDDESETIDVE